MSWLDGVSHRLRAVLNPGKYERDLEEEMEHHLELEALHLGDSEGARRRFGDRDFYREETRRLTWLGVLDVLRQDARHAWGSVVRAPGATVMVVTMLALGIGANAAIFTVLDRLYLRAPDGVGDPSSLRRVWVQRFNTGDGAPQWTQALSYPMYRALAAAAGDTSSVAVYENVNDLRLGWGRGAPRLRAVYASANYFSVLGVRTAMGRFFTQEEDRLGAAHAVVVVSHRFWSNQLGGDSGVLGTSLEIGGDPYTIIGVLEPAFAGLDLQPVDVYLPVSGRPQPEWLQEPWWIGPLPSSFRAIRRTHAGVPEREYELRATAQVRGLSRQLVPRRPDTLMTVRDGSIVEARGPGKPATEHMISARLGAVALVVLLAACANVVNLLLARSLEGRREVAVRLALGISRRRLIRLHLLETLILAVLAGAAALLAAAWGGALLRALLMPEVEWSGPVMDARVLVFTLTVALFAGAVAGTVSAMQSSRVELTAALKKSGWDAGRPRSRLRGGLVMIQAALSVPLLVCAVLFVRSLHNVQSLHIGFDRERMLVGSVDFSNLGGPPPPAPVIAAGMRDLVARLEGRAEVEAAARAGQAPMAGSWNVRFFFGADSVQSLGRKAPVVIPITPGYFSAVGTRVMRGRPFSGGDTDDGPPEVVVNSAAAQLLWPTGEALGQCIRFDRRDQPCYTVVGVVENTRLFHVLEDEPAAQLYVPLGNLPFPFMEGSVIVVRARAGAGGVATVLRDELERAFPAADPVVRSMTQQLEPQIRQWRLGATLFTLFGSLALVVALLGIYTTVSYGVHRRMQEFGVRIALGARARDVLADVVGNGLRPVLVGIVAGTLLALAASRAIAPLLFGVAPWDPGPLMMVATALLAVATLAAIFPAWRATRVDPTRVLKAE